MDEKWFSLDDPDGISTFMYLNEIYGRIKRQKNGGGVMIWDMIVSNRLLAYKILNGSFVTSDYVNILSNIAVPITKLNLGLEIYLQLENSRIHTSKIT